MGIAGIILGIIGIIAAAIATLVFGWIGGAAGIVLGAVAAVLGILSRKKSGKGGVGAIVTGLIAVIIAVALIPSTEAAMKTLKENALKELDNQGSKFPTVAKYAEQADTGTGFYGFLASMLSKVPEEDKAALEAELNEITILLNEKNSTADTATDAPSATEAPAEEPAAEPAG